jgi:hypothetical protein
MFGVGAVTGSVCTSGFAGFAGVAGVVGVAPPLAAGVGEAAATPPVFDVAKAGEAARPSIVKLQKIVLLRVRTRTTTTSFVGLRG